MKNPLVSIIMPMYNAEKFIRQSIESVLKQTYTNWELLIIDDCSTDQSKKIVFEFINECKKIKYLKHEENLGVAEARNTGINNSNGRFIAFLDTDDIWKSKKLEKQIKFMINNNYVFTYTSYGIVDSNNNKLGRQMNIPRKLAFKDLLKGNNIGCFTVIIDKKEINNIKMPHIRHEDYATWLNILKKGYVAYGIKEKLGYYRKSKDSLTSNKINSSIWTWNIYRKHLKLSFLKSSYYFFFYILNSVNKHFL